MSTNNSIELKHNANEIYQAFNDLLARSSDLAPAMREIAGVLEDAAEQAFANETSLNGVEWDDLSVLTQGMRSKKNKWPGQILQQSGRLAASIESSFSDSSVQIGTNVIYAAMHQFGGKTSPKSMFPNTTIPARPFLGVGPEDEDEILNILRDYLAGD